VEVRNLIRGWQTMKRRFLFLVAIGVLALCSSCILAPWWGAGKQMRESVKENEAISEKIRKDVIAFYENIALAYYLLGFDYYKLYREATDSKNEQAATQYFNNAARYQRYYFDLMESVRVMRKNFDIPEPGRPLTPDATSLGAFGPGAAMPETLPPGPAVPGPAAPAPVGPVGPVGPPLPGAPAPAGPKQPLPSSEDSFTTRLIIGPPPGPAGPKISPPATSTLPGETVGTPATRQKPSLLRVFKFLKKRTRVEEQPL